MSTEVRAEMAATVLRTTASVGDAVAEGDVLLVLESMTMELPVLAEGAGTVTALPAAPGTAVQEGDLLAVLD